MADRRENLRSGLQLCIDISGVRCDLVTLEVRKIRKAII